MTQPSDHFRFPLPKAGAFVADEYTESWFDRAVGLLYELTEDERIALLEHLSNENDFSADEAVNYSMMMACLAQFSDERVEEVLGHLSGQTGVGSQVTLHDVRKWSLGQADYGGIVHGAWVNNIFYQGLQEQLPPSVVEARARDALDRMVESSFMPTTAAAGEWLADRVVRIMPTRVESALAFLRVLTDNSVVAAREDALHAELVHLRTPGATAIWSTAIRIHDAGLAMSSAISSARQVFAAVADSERPELPRRRAASV